MIEDRENPLGSDAPVRLSVVIITRNLEWNVERIVTSVLDGLESFPGRTEVVLVDSASTDRTVDLARAHPIDVYPLSDAQPLSAAAGRYVGFRRTVGEYVLFLDGDMELMPGWVEGALELLDDDDTIGVVGPRRIDLPVDAELGTPAPIDGPTPVIKDVPHAGGCAIYRRSALDEVGQWNPFIYSDEEPELCIRIRHRGGYRVVRLDTPGVRHYTDPDDRLSTLIARSRRNLYVGAGQNLRFLLGRDTFTQYARERGFGLVPLVWVFSGLPFALQSIRTRRIRWLAVWLLPAVGAGSAIAVRERSVHAALHALLRRALITLGTVRGFLMTPHDPAEYPELLDVRR